MSMQVVGNDIPKDAEILCNIMLTAGRDQVIGYLLYDGRVMAIHQGITTLFNNPVEWWNEEQKALDPRFFMKKEPVDDKGTKG